jgi:hypothetical protein
LDEYVAMLQNRDKWQTSETNLKVGQLVLLASCNQPRDQWKIGIVDDLEARGDGRVRKDVVKLKGGKKLCRHSNALMSLEIEK